MYGGKHVAEGDTIFAFASENEGGHGEAWEALYAPEQRPDGSLRSPAARC
jgi:hypothetical protein